MDLEIKMVNILQEVKMKKINKATIANHFDYEDLYIGNILDFENLPEDEKFNDEYMIDVDPGMYQMIYWNDEGPDSISCNSKKEYVIESITNFWGEDSFIEKFKIEDEIYKAGDNWGNVFDKHVEDNLDMYFEELKKYTNNSYPDKDSACGVVLLENNKIIAGKANKV